MDGKNLIDLDIEVDIPATDEDSFEEAFGGAMRKMAESSTPEQQMARLRELGPGKYRMRVLMEKLG